MTTMGTLSVVGVDVPTGDRGQRALHAACFVEGVAAYRDLDSPPLRRRQAGVDGGLGGAPVLVQLESAGPGKDLLVEGLLPHRIALAKQQNVHRPVVKGFEHAGRCQAPVVTVVASVPSTGPAPPDDGGGSRRNRLRWLGLIKWTWQSTAGRENGPLSASTSVEGPTTRCGCTPSIVSGLPAFPSATIRP